MDEAAAHLPAWEAVVEALSAVLEALDRPFNKARVLVEDPVLQTATWLLAMMGLKALAAAPRAQALENEISPVEDDDWGSPPSDEHE